MAHKLVEIRRIVSLERQILKVMKSPTPLPDGIWYGSYIKLGLRNERIFFSDQEFFDAMAKLEAAGKIVKVVQHGYKIAA